MQFLDNNGDGNFPLLPGEASYENVGNPPPFLPFDRKSSYENVGNPPPFLPFDRKASSASFISTGIVRG